MKRFTTTLAISLLCLTASSQAKKDTVATDNTPILSIKDVAVVDSLLQKKINKFELADYNQVLNYLQQLIGARVREYNIANKPSPVKK
jgi:hypothetical protein